MFKRLQASLFTPVDIAPLVFFRIVFGGIMLWEVWRYFEYDRIARYYVEPTYYFPYLGFGWFQPLHGDGMFLLFYLLGALAVLIALGAFYRVSTAIFWVCFTYVFLLDKAQYLNHFYLVSLVSFLLIFIPAHRAFSVDVWLRPAIRSQTAPAWALWLLRGQMALVYIFGGLAKINPDWLAGEPLRQWLSESTSFPVIGHLFTQEWMVYLFSYGGLLLDLFIVPLLLWRRTRIPALLLAVAFHLANAQLFNIGIFPWFAIAATLLFLPPSWFRPSYWRNPQPVTHQPIYPARHRWIVAGILLYFAVQIALPLRHWLYPGYTSWTEEGHTLAWHMRLRSKDAYAVFYASDPDSGTSWQVPADAYLSSRQHDQMDDDPHMLLRFSHYLAGTLRPTFPNIRVHVWSMVSLNNRARQLMIDPTADLSRQPDSLLAADWILPLEQQPYPAAVTPTLLVSRRQADVLYLVNITETAFPLADLVIQAGDFELRGSNFGLAELQPHECLLAHSESADLRAIFAPCNEAAARQVIDAALLTNVLQVTTATASRTCTTPTCLIPSPP